MIEDMLGWRATLEVMSIGSGKSLCYQIPALALDGLTMVVSPLIAMMKDQVEQLHDDGGQALFLTSSLQPGEYQEIMAQVRDGSVRLLYVAFSSASPDQQAAAFAIFNELGTALLKPVFDRLNGTLNYNELKILRLYYLSRNG